MPLIEPDDWSYRQLLALGRDMSRLGRVVILSLSRNLSGWGELADPTRSILSQGKRIAQEHVGCEFLEQIKQR